MSPPRIHRTACGLAAALLGAILTMAPSSPFRDAIGGAVHLLEGRSESPPIKAAAPSTPPELAYVPPSPAPSTTNPAALPAPATPQQDALSRAFSAYASGDLHTGDSLAAQLADPVARTTLEWAALHAPTSVGFDRLAAFLTAHPHWPGGGWVARAAEEALWRDRRSAEVVAAFFAHRAPQTSMGSLALARALTSLGRGQEAAAIVRRVWREGDLFPVLETQLRDEFGGALTAADDQYRAERLLYKGDVAGALRAASHAGGDVLALIRAGAAAKDGRASPSVMDSVPQALRHDPAYIFAEISRLRRLNKASEAASLMLSAPRDPAALINPDAWWRERRWIARKLLDQGDAKTAYQICLTALPGSGETALDAEFHAGWIALRFLSEPQIAEPHFARLAALATMPVSKARGLYWLGRSEAALKETASAIQDYRTAAFFSTTYYGQIAQGMQGVPPTASAPPPPPQALRGAARDEAIQAVELLGSHGLTEEALDLAIQTAHVLTDPGQLAALAAVGQELGDARETLAVGKIAERRGFALDEAAFPTFGVPAYAPLAASAPEEIVYSIARQESAFRTNALSTAGAHGLMQMILSTARRTAQLFRVPFDAQRLSRDPAYNAELGAAHLGLLLREQRGSLLLTFAAYNAGGHRVQEWIDAYGDPRNPKVDWVDWVERIPISETRDYVQRVLENYNVYKARFAQLRVQPALGRPQAGKPLPQQPAGAPAGPPSNAPATVAQARS